MNELKKVDNQLDMSWFIFPNCQFEIKTLSELSNIFKKKSSKKIQDNQNIVTQN